MNAARLAALVTLSAGCDGLEIRPGSFFATDNQKAEIVSFDERLPDTFNVAVRTCMLTPDQPTMRLEPGDAPVLFDQCAPHVSENGPAPSRVKIRSASTTPWRSSTSWAASLRRRWS